MTGPRPPTALELLEDALPDTLEELQELINEVYAPSRAIPEGPIRDGIPVEITALLDFFNQNGLVLGNFELRKLVDIEAMNRAALILVLTEMGIPVPEFVTTEQMRQLARDAGFINKFRNTTKGWEQYLRDIVPGNADVVVSGDTLGKLFFIPGVAGHMLPGVKELKSAGGPGDSVAYLIGSGHFNHEITISISCPTPNWDQIEGFPPQTFEQFVHASSPHFIPMSTGETVVNVIVQS